MVEATDNNLFAIVGALLAVVIVYYWRKARSFEVYLVSPISNYLSQLFVSQPARPEVELRGNANKWGITDRGSG